VLQGERHCFRSEEAAYQVSCGVAVDTAGRRTLKLLSSRGTELYLALGEAWIGDDGRRGRHYYGRASRYIDLEVVS
jgi:hypothetical protein